MIDRRLRTVSGLAAASLILAACGGGSGAGDDTSADEAAAPTDQAPASPAPASGGDDAGQGDGATPEILQFTSPLVGGGELDAASLASTPTAFWFWAPS